MLSSASIIVSYVLNTEHNEDWSQWKAVPWEAAKATLSPLNYVYMQLNISKYVL